MKCPLCKGEFKCEWGVKGGKKSKRTITEEQQRKMQEGRKHGKQ